MAAYRDLAYALARAGSQLLGPAERIAGLRHATRPDLTEVAMLHLVDDLHRLGHPRPFHAAPPARGAGAAWAEASRTAGAAADLLATHRGPDGQHRTPTPVLDDPAVRRAGYAQLAALAGPLAGAAPLLARRAVDAGADWTRLEHLLPNAELAAQSATDVRALARAGAIAKTLANTLAGAERLDTLQVARPAVRTGEPLVELGDRWARLHRSAWQLSRDPRPGVGTLADYATAAVLLTEATGATLSRAAQADTAQGRPAQPWQRHADALAAQATGWRQVRVELAALRTPTPALLGVRADIHAIRDLLITLTDPRTAAPAIRTLPVLLAGTRTLPDLATFNAATLDRLAATGDLYVTGAALPRDLLSEQPRTGRGQTPQHVGGGATGARRSRTRRLRVPARSPSGRRAVAGARAPCREPDRPGTLTDPVPERAVTSAQPRERYGEPFGIVRASIRRDLTVAGGADFRPPSVRDYRTLFTAGMRVSSQARPKDPAMAAGATRRNLASGASATRLMARATATRTGACST